MSIAVLTTDTGRYLETAESISHPHTILENALKNLPRNKNNLDA
jgi:hypothetical protein